MSDNNSARNGGIGFCGLLTIVLILIFFSRKEKKC